METRTFGGIRGRHVWWFGLRPYVHYGPISHVQLRFVWQIQLPDPSEMEKHYFEAWASGEPGSHTLQETENDQFREGSEVVIPSNEEKRSACIYRLFEHWRALSPSAGDDNYVFLDFPMN